MTSSMENQIFREDGGRRFQAENDDYSLPADNLEFARLDFQHYGQKAILRKNYLAPMAQALAADSNGRQKRALDIGSGSGIWPIEMAQEFPDVEWTGIDLFPIEKDNLPSNLEFLKMDASQRMDFPDNHFDLVHSRTLVAGIRNWPEYIEEVIRITRPGGLIAVVENSLPKITNGRVPGSLWDVAPGFAVFHQMCEAAIKIRGYDTVCGAKTIPVLLRSHDLLENVKSEPVLMPLTMWSDVPHERDGGRLMKENLTSVPDTLKVLIMDCVPMSEEKYQGLADGWRKDLQDNAPIVCVRAGLMYHNWGWKKQ